MPGFLAGYDTRRCKCCANTFMVKPYNRGSYCSETCRNRAIAITAPHAPPRRENPIICARAGCGSEVITKHPYAPAKRYCNARCASRDQMARVRQKRFLRRAGYIQDGMRWLTPDGKHLSFEEAQERAGLSKKAPKHAVTTDGITVWVNGPDGLLGRFGQNGIDIHRPSKDQELSGECLYCTHGEVTRKDWDTFVVKMREHYGIRIHGPYMPTRFKRLSKR